MNEPLPTGSVDEPAPGSGLPAGAAEDRPEAGGLWARTVASGHAAVRAMIGCIPFLGGVAAEEVEDLAADEHHYFLIPFPAATQGYVLYQLRRLPPGVAAANDLPVRRIFHLPGEGAERRLEELILERDAPGPVASDLSDRLHRVADEIDRQSMKVTGGFLLIGGVVAVVNPVVGLGIAAKALFPSLGAIASRESLKFLADRWRGWRQSRVERIARAQSLEELHAAPVRCRTEEVLVLLERALATSAEEFDPVAAFDPGRRLLPEDRDGMLLCARAVLAVYDELDAELLAANRVGGEDEAFLALLRTLVAGPAPGEEAPP